MVFNGGVCNNSAEARESSSKLDCQENSIRLPLLPVLYCTCSVALRTVCNTDIATCTSLVSTWILGQSIMSLLSCVTIQNALQMIFPGGWFGSTSTAIILLQSYEGLCTCVQGVRVFAKMVRPAHILSEHEDIYLNVIFSWNVSARSTTAVV